MRWLPGIYTLTVYKRSWLRGDIVAGIVLTALLIPAGMGYAEVAGLPPVYGLYATIVPLAVYAVLGPSRILVLGPDSALAPIIAAAIIPLAVVDKDRPAIAALLAVEVGIVLLLAAVLRLGFVTDLLSKPIRIGYLNGIALVVILGQLPTLFGFDTAGDTIIAEIVEIFSKLNSGGAQALPTAVGVVCLAVILILKRWLPLIPGVLVAVAGAMILVAAMHWTDKDLKVVGAMPSGLPDFDLAGVTVSNAIALIPAAIGISLIAFADTSVLSRTLSAKSGHDVSPSQEMAAIGAANVATGFLSGFPVSASASRTPVAQQAGAKTQLAPLVGALMIVLFIIFIPGLTRYLPSTALAAVVITAAISFVDVKSVISLFRADWVEGALSVAAFAGVAVLGVLEGILVAVGLSFVAFVNQAWRPYRTELGRVPGLRGYHDITRYPEAEQIEDAVIVRIDAPLFFANAGMFDDYVRAKVRKAWDAGRDVTTVVIAAEPITEIDATGVDELVELDDYLRTHDITLLLAEMKSPVREQLARYDLVVNGEPRFGDDRFPPTVGAAVDSITGRLRTDIVPGEPPPATNGLDPERI